MLNSVMTILYLVPIVALPMAIASGVYLFVMSVRPAEMPLRPDQPAYTVNQATVRR